MVVVDIHLLTVSVTMYTRGCGAGACGSQTTTFESQFFLSINVGPGDLTPDVRIDKHHYQLSYLTSSNMYQMGQK